MSRKILFITTSHTQMGQTGRQTGIWAEEVAAPYLIFAQAGYDIDLASPQGGAAPFDPGSLKPAGQNNPTIEQFLADAVAQDKVRHTLRVADVNAQGYDAVFFPGGHGAMWDLPVDANVARIVEQAYAQGKVIGAVCHGVAGLVSARQADGRAIVAGRRVNSFTNQEEQAAGLTEVVPFLLESRLTELGGLFEKAPNWSSFAVNDGQLVTGQNPASSAQVATQVLLSLATQQAVAA
jgi:putative intracellular protease/amidase